MAQLVPPATEAIGVAGVGDEVKHIVLLQYTSPLGMDAPLA